MSNKTFNLTDELKQQLLANTTTWLTDSLYLYLIGPMSLIGFLSNSITLIIFTKRIFSKYAHYKYLKIYAFVSYLITLHLIVLLLTQTPNYFFNLATSHFARVFRCLVVPSYGLKLLVFYSNAMDAVLNLERASNFNLQLKRFNNASPFLISFIVFIICFLINLPYGYLLELNDDHALYTTFEFCKKTKFNNSLAGNVTLLIVFIIEGPILLLLVTLSNVCSYMSMKSYFDKKIETIQLNESEYLTDTQTLSKQMSKIMRMDKRMTFFTIYVTLFSLFFHVILFIASICFFILNVDMSVAILLQFVIILTVALRNSCLVFFFIGLNKHFRKEFANLFLCKT